MANRNGTPVNGQAPPCPGCSGMRLHSSASTAGPPRRPPGRSLLPRRYSSARTMLPLPAAWPSFPVCCLSRGP